MTRLRLSLREDDCQLLDDVLEWQRRPVRDVQRGLMLVLNVNHRDALVANLRIAGWTEVRDEFRSPRGDRLDVRVAKPGLGRGTRVDQLFIHPDCPDQERLRAALYPCLA